ncbi:MAG: Lactoylglutathione lyase [Firmicutes bacterium]|nr:Lactoylglutathione lyase [Bacillota bacterium]MDI6706705.1 VOC family protein [Bacillota bacterium]
MKYAFATVKVKDMEESLEFYTGVLMLKEVLRFSPQKGVDIVFLEDKNGNKIELIASGHMKNACSEDSVQLVSIGFEVEDLDKTMEVLKEKDIPVVRGPVETPGGERFIFVLDPNGAEIEFIQGFKI